MPQDHAVSGATLDTSYADRVRADHYAHKLLMFGAGAYAWQLHGLLAGLALLALLFLVIMATNVMIMVAGGSFRSLRVNRWSWVVVAYLLIAISGASGGSGV